MRTFRNILIGLMILISARLSAEPIGDIISYQGKLTNADGTPVENNKTHTVTFKIYENGTEKFSQTFDNINTLGGVFSVFLGGSVPLPNFDPGNEYKLGIAADGGAETTHQIASVPVAKVASSLKTGVDIVAGKGTFNGGLVSDTRDIQNSVAIDGRAAYAGVAGTGTIGLKGWTSTGTAVMGFSDGTGRLFAGVNASGTQQVDVFSVDCTGKGTFNGGVNSDMRTVQDSTAINGEGFAFGVRGYSPDGSGVFGETINGDAIQARVTDAKASLFRGRYYGSTYCRIDSSGRGFFNGGTQQGGADYADLVTVSGKAADYEPGDVLVIGVDPACPFTKASVPYAKNVAGIYSTKPGVLGSKRGIEPAADNEIPLALTGMVPCKVSCENGSIRMGDLLVTSGTPGYAMRGTNKSKMLGAVLGKALQPLTVGKGVIEVLVVQR